MKKLFLIMISILLSSNSFASNLGSISCKVHYKSEHKDFILPITLKKVDGSYTFYKAEKEFFLDSETRYIISIRANKDTTSDLRSLAHVTLGVVDGSKEHTSTNYLLLNDLSKWFTSTYTKISRDVVVLSECSFTN